MKPVLLRQPAGMGDIFMCMKIAKTYQDKGHDIIWPIYPQYMYIDQYLIKDFSFVSTEDDFLGKEIFRQDPTAITETDEIIYIPLERASYIVGEPVMSAKFRLVDTTMDDYLDYFSFNRNEEREKSLFGKVLQLMDISKYRLCNRNYASLPDVRYFDRSFVQTARNLYEIDMYINEYSHLFDWCMTVENATEFHTVGTSITFIAEKLNLKCEQLFMYRRPEAQLSNFAVERGLFKKPWSFIL